MWKRGDWAMVEITDVSDKSTSAVQIGDGLDAWWIPSSILHPLPPTLPEPDPLDALRDAINSLCVAYNDGTQKDCDATWDTVDEHLASVRAALEGGE